jgi:hypothetical protein
MARKYGGPNGYGHKPDKAGIRKSVRLLLHGKTTLVGAFTPVQLAATPNEVSLEPFEPEIMDQGGTSSCTGHATSAGIATTVLAQAARNVPIEGIPLPPSPDGLYRIGRCEERLLAGDNGPLLDVGTIPSAVMRGMSEVGVRPMGSRVFGRNSDVDPATVNNEPTAEELDADAKGLVVGEYEIDPTADDFIALLRATLTKGFSICVAIFADTKGPRSVENWDPATGPLGAPDRNDPDGGGHYILITSYRTAADGSTIFRGMNSWGEEWGLAGHWEGNEDFARGMTDIVAMNVRRAA